MVIIDEDGIHGSKSIDHASRPPYETDEANETDMVNSSKNMPEVSFTRLSRNIGTEDAEYSDNWIIRHIEIGDETQYTIHWSGYEPRDHSI